SSTYVIDKLRQEDIRQGNGGDKNSVLMTARAEFVTKKRSREEPVVAYSAPAEHKRARTEQSSSTKPRCENEHCSSPIGHTKSECLAYKGDKAGQYPEWYKGSRTIHLPPHERDKANRAEAIRRGSNRRGN